MRIVCHVLLISWFAATISNAATLYMGPDETYTNFREAVTAMLPGDTLIIRDGTYTGIENMLTDAYFPPNGSAGGFTVIQAEHVGGVIIDGQHMYDPVYVTSTISEYIYFSGIIFKNSNSGPCVIVQAPEGNIGSHIWFSDCGFIDAGQNSTGSGNGLWLRRIDYALVERCFTCGELYYGIIFEHCHYGVMRQCVGRYDIHRGALGGLFAAYSSEYIEIQNCIAIDSDQDSLYTGTTEGIKGFASPNTTGQSIGNYYKGCIALNLIADGKIYTGLISANYGGSDIRFDDFVAYDTSGGMWDRIPGGSYTNCVFAESRGNFIGEGIAGSGSLTYSLIFGNDVRGSNVSIANYNNYYDNTFDGNTGTGNVTINPLINGYLYLPRVESGSILEGNDMGPDITKKIGVSGTFYGEAGYNTKTNDDLWPFPNEGIIRDKFSEYTGNSNGTVNGARGFCADTVKQLDGVSDVTLTSYIWEYLGNQIPGDIYGASGLTCYLDADGDMYSDGTSEIDVETCSTNFFEAGNLTATSGDCDDSNATINPGATELCGNAVDEDCDGTAQACSSCSVSITSIQTSSQADYTLTANLTAGIGTVSGVTVNGTSVDCADGACDEAVEELSYPVSLVVGNNPFNVAIEDGGSGCGDSISVNYSSTPGHVMTIGNSGPPIYVGNSGTAITVSN